jgi:hypothetical protein
MKMGGVRSDFMFKHTYGFFKKSKHTDVNEFSNLIFYLPFELNKNYSNFQLQTNDYIQSSFFRENTSFINETMDSSFSDGKDTGKKLTVVFALFPEDLEISRRMLNFKLKFQECEKIFSKNNENDEKNSEIIIEKNPEYENPTIDINFTTPISCLIFKSRKFIYEVPKHDFPFILVFYYIHGPMDKTNFSA